MTDTAPAISDGNLTHPHWLLVYGTLKRGHGNNPLLVRYNSLFVAPAVTAAKFLLNDGFPYVFPAPSAKAPEMDLFLGQVRGDLYRVTDEGLKHADALEGHPTGYTRTPIEVHYFLDGPGEQVVTAGIYLMRYGERGYVDLQRPDENGFLEWGRERKAAARNFQRRTGARFRNGK